MSHDKNIVRDRTLILRVLVPGLHTSLNDKINAKKDGEDSSSSSAATSPGGQRMSADKILNLDGVTCMPSAKGSTLWHFRCDGLTLPARLVSFPCPIEVHKTHDHANYHKSADVGQMLIVYADKYAMEEAENEKGYNLDGFPSYYHSGLTPPMQRVVQRRYLSRFEERDTKPVPPPKSEISEVEKELQELMAKLSTGKGKQKRGGNASISGKEKVIEEVEDEIVEYEPWMGEGGVFTIDDAAKHHPEWWLSKSEIKEIDAAKKEARAVEEEKRRAEVEARAKEEAAAKKKQEEKAEKKKKKKDKKKKKQQAEQAIEDEVAAAASVGDGKKKGIPSIKNREPAVVDSGAGEIDEVTAAAMTINEGIEGGEEDLFFGTDGDDMFDFENEDISDLLT
ncbi:hypothetical protein ACHAXR_006257 [Thalassiosira sp. AJA248-18]